mmetsp:Transcript_29530/g.60877  ORF Transcript_29530/g.60877 Transcript_29530/m.60877 type:complete len:210 (-) Transcript_29530:63-692(-)
MKKPSAKAMASTVIADKTKAKAKTKAKTKAKPKTKAKGKSNPHQERLDNAREALEVCRQLSEGELALENLGKSPETEGYKLLRDLLPSWLSKHEKMTAKAVPPSYDYTLWRFAQVCSFEIDGPSLSEESLFKILFSDKNDKRFYTMGVENGHFIRDGAHYFYEYLVEKKIDPKDLEKKLKVKQLKILEDLLVAFAGLPEKSCASHKFWR